jgi:GNAT superfamily N-acetyltransferase
MPVLLITRSPSVHDAVVPLCAAAGVGAEVCAEPSLSLASWREADLVLVGDDLAGALVGLAPPRRTGVHVVGVGVGDDAFRHAVELGAAFAGCVALRPGADGRWLEHFYLDPGVQGRGLGSAILRNLLNRTDADGLVVRLTVLRGSAARRLYERHGFTVESEDPIDISMVR